MAWLEVCSRDVVRLCPRQNRWTVPEGIFFPPTRQEHVLNIVILVNVSHEYSLVIHLVSYSYSLQSSVGVRGIVHESDVQDDGHLT